MQTKLNWTDVTYVVTGNSDWYFTQTIFLLKLNDVSSILVNFQKNRKIMRIHDNKIKNEVDKKLIIIVLGIAHMRWAYENWISNELTWTNVIYVLPT